MSGWPDSLRYFMWPWQVYFRISCQTAAEGLFRDLDRGLDPYAFVIGFRTNDDASIEPVCIEPEALHYDLSEFKDIAALAESIYRNDPDRRMLYGGAGMQEEMEERGRKKAFREAIEEVLNNSPNNPGKYCFASSAVLINKYEVFVVLELNREVYDQRTPLKQRLMDDRFRIYRSILETAVIAYLDDKSKSLYLPDPGKNLSLEGRAKEELLREAARQFMYTISSKGKNFMGLHQLFDLCNDLSRMRYEGMENTGQLIIAAGKNQHIELTMELDEMFPLDKKYRSRKMLQLSNESQGIVTDTHDVRGLGIIKNSYSPDEESVFSICFRDLYCWDVMHNGNILFEMRYGLPQFTREVINKERFFADALRIFPEINKEQLEGLFELAIAAASQGRGCMLVITSDAAEETERLKSQCFKVKPSRLTAELLSKLNLIDGAVLVDVNANIFAYGVILDGVISTKGDAGRGSRYNSAVTYQQHRDFDKPTLIVVVSDDGMVDVIPTLEPQIRHSEILGVINALEELNERPIYEAGPFSAAMEWLSNRSFYLTSEECAKINRLKGSIVQKPKEGLMTWRVFDDVRPNPDMSDRYYIKEDEIKE